MKHLNKQLSWAICLVVLVGLSCSKREQRDLKVGEGLEAGSSATGSKILALNSGTFADCYDEFGDQNSTNYHDPSALANCLDQNGGEDLVDLLGNEPELSTNEDPLDESFQIREFTDLMSQASISTQSTPSTQLAEFISYYEPGIESVKNAYAATLYPSSVPRAIRDKSIAASYYLHRDYPNLTVTEYNQMIQYIRSAIYYNRFDAASVGPQELVPQNLVDLGILSLL